MEGILTGKEWPLLHRFRAFFNQPPPGYSPGAALRHVLKELGGDFVCTRVETTGAQLKAIASHLPCLVTERVERHFLMHIVAHEFRFNVPGAALPGAEIDVRNTGLLFRKGIACSVPAKLKTALKTVTDRIEGDEPLRAILMKLDFRSCRVRGSEEGWSVCLEPYGASEVVNRKPSFRRYIRLTPEQSGLVAGTIGEFTRILGTI